MNGTHALPSRTASLVRAARAALESRGAVAGSTTAAAAGGLDVDIDLDIAMRHGMLAWIPNMPIEARRTHAQHALRGIHRLLEVAKALDDAGIPFITFKGPALSQWLYGDPCARRFADIDLLVTEARVADALAVLESRGYRSHITRRPDGVAYRWMAGWPLSRSGGEDLDLHRRLLGPRFGKFLDSATVINESMTIRVAGRALRMPRPEHSAAIAIVHSAKHHWYALECVFALATMTRFAAVNWDEVYELLRATGAINAGVTGFVLVKTLFDVDPPAAFHHAAARRDADALLSAAMQSLSLPPGEFPDRRLDRRLQRLVLDRRIDRVRFDLMRIFEPTQADCEWLDLPERLGMLYWLVRPLRLAARQLHR